MYTYDEVFATCKEYFNGDELATTVLINKYLLRDKDGNLLENHPNQMFERISNEFFRIELKYKNSLSKEEIFDALKDFKYIIPQGSPLFGIGNNNQLTSLANCFVIDSPEDSYGGIIQKDEELAQLMKRRGGVGIDISSLRPKDVPINNAAKTSDGIVSFMERYSNTTKEVAQGGRRGALLISIDCNHPEITSFIDAKKDLTKITGANISVKWSDLFLSNVEQDKEHILQFPVNSDTPKFTKKIKAKEVWNKFVENAWLNGEPGCLFWDKITKQSLSDCYESHKSLSTNPCGELPLGPYGACVLMSINLTGFVDNPYLSNASFNYDKFDKYLYIAAKLIDNIIDLELEKIDLIINKIENDPETDKIKRNELDIWNKLKNTYLDARRVGLGITGLADTLAMLNIKYSSNKSLEKCEEIFKFFHISLMKSQVTLANDRGSFKCWNWEKEKDCHYIKILPEHIQKSIKTYGRRNITITTMPPTGSISLLAQISSGIEPLFKLLYNRRRKMSQEEINKNIVPSSIDNEGIKWINYDVEHHGLMKWKKANPNKKELSDANPYIGNEANDIDWKYRIKLQGILQKYITSAISSTINLSKTVTKEEVSQIYLMAWKEGLKGITIYREGSRAGILTNKDNKEEITEVKCPVAKKRPDILPCDIKYSNIEGNNWIFFIGLDDGKPYELFGGKKSSIEIPKKYKRGWIKKNGKNDDGIRTYDLYLGSLEESDEQMIIKDIATMFSSKTGSYTRMISGMLSHCLPISFICEQLHKDVNASIFSFEKGIAKVLKTYIKDGELASGTCQSCKSDKLEYREGCVYCSVCGWSKC